MAVGLQFQRKDAKAKDAKAKDAKAKDAKKTFASLLLSDFALEIRAAFMHFRTRYVTKSPPTRFDFSASIETAIVKA